MDIYAVVPVQACKDTYTLIQSESPNSDSMKLNKRMESLDIYGKDNDGNVCIVTQEIRNKLNEIITETLAEQKVVLSNRRKDLKTWQLEEKKFLIIFGRNEGSAKNWMLKGG